MAAAAAAACVTPPPGPRGGAIGSAKGSGGEGEGKTWSVIMEKCYVMVSCHRNHPVMFKVRGWGSYRREGAGVGGRGK